MSDAISRKQLKNELYALWAENTTKATWDAGYREGLRRALEAVGAAPAVNMDDKYRKMVMRLVAREPLKNDGGTIDPLNQEIYQVYLPKIDNDEADLRRFELVEQIMDTGVYLRVVLKSEAEHGD